MTTKTSLEANSLNGNRSTIDPASVIRFIREYAVYFALLILIVVFSISSPAFFSLANFLNIGRQTTLVTVIAAGMTFVIIAGEIDLSIGAVLALSGVVSAMTMQANGDSVLLGVISGIGTGALAGLITGLTTTTLKIPSFLVSLGMLGIARGVALMITDTKAVPVENPDFWAIFGEGSILGMPAPVFFTGLTILVMGYLLHLTAFGRRVYAVGGNAKAADYSGINVTTVKTLCFVLTGCLVGLAGMILTGRAHAARPDIAAGLELDVLAAVILGGTSLFGGRGAIIGTVMGSLLIGVINNGLTLLSFTSASQLVVKGLLIIVAVAFSKQR
jgi:ribose transport system permease protein